MEVERKRSKGVFFQLFDWNGKSRKKLFASTSEFSGSKQVKENINSLSGQHHFTEPDNAVNLSNRCSNDYNCALSVASDEGYASRPPGVVARLMGLDSLPTPNLLEPCPPQNFQEYPSIRGYRETRTTLQSFSSNGEEPRLGKMQNRAIERFQTETLPPKSAKSIPSTHHKLLSPIKGPGFVSTRNAACIMEAAAKIIEASPNSKISSIGSSSVPLRIRDLKEKMEVAQKTPRPQEKMEVAQKTPRPQRLKEHTAVRYTKGDKGLLSLETKNPENVKNKGKSGSLALQAKLNVQSNRSLTNQREQNELNSKSNPKSKSNPNLSQQKIAQKRNPSARSNNALKQNNIKQNCASNKGAPASKKPGPTNGAVGPNPNRTVSTVFINSETGSRNTKPSSSKTKNFPRKGSVKRGDRVQDGVANPESTSTDKSSICDADGSEKGMDVISFTFTSPLQRPIHDPLSSGVDSLGDSDQSYSNYSTSSSPRSNVIGSDALSLLLDQKLRELAHRVECSHNKPWSSSSASSGLQDSVSMINVIVPTSREHGKNFQPGSFYGCDCPTIDDPVSVDGKWQGPEGLEECSTSSNYNESAKELSCRHPLYTSNLESSYFGGSDRENRNDDSRGEKDYLFVHSQEPSISLSTCQSITVEGETELSDSASSISNLDSRLTHAKKSENWEIEYLKKILKSELRLKDFLSGQTDNVISPDLFYQLENQETDTGEQSKLGRKLIFDCALERLALRCKSRRLTWETLVNGKGSLAEQLQREISGLRDMGELMVDELVDRDMSTGLGRWLGFDMEALEEGVEVEKAILSSLIHELVIDFMF